MREPPALAEATIVTALQASFGIRVAALDFLPIGNDSASWAYRIEAAQGPAWFLKIRPGAGPIPGAAVPSHLHRHGVTNVLAPLATHAGAPYVLVDGFALALYPMPDARVGAEVGLSEAQWRQLGAAVRQLHRVPLTPELARMVGREAFRPTRRELVADLEALVATVASDDPTAWELAGFWQEHQGVIGALVHRADVLGRHLARSSFPHVLCHADLHSWNVLVDADQQLWLVDWDEAILAPKERDLMFVVGGIGHGLVRPGDTDSFSRAMARRRSIHACSPTTAVPGRSKTSPPAANRYCWHRNWAKRPGGPRSRASWTCSPRATSSTWRRRQTRPARLVLERLEATATVWPVATGQAG
jgi:spectinomycin phosphotransferase